MTNTFSIKEAIVFGWHKVKEHSQLVFGVVLTMFALQVASSVVQKVLQNTLIGAAASVVLAVLGVVLGAGMTLIFLRLARGERAHYRDIVPAMRLVWRYFLASVASGVISFLPIMAGGLAALILLVSSGAVNPGGGFSTAMGVGAGVALAALVMAVAVVCTVYLALRYSFARLAALDGARVGDSLRQSSKLTHGVKWHLVLFVLALIAVNLLGLLVFIVGLLVSVPVSVFAFVHVYLKLKAHHR
jgi:uncharacterized membrane protein